MYYFQLGVDEQEYPNSVILITSKKDNYITNDPNALLEIKVIQDLGDLSHYINFGIEEGLHEINISDAKRDKLFHARQYSLLIFEELTKKDWIYSTIISKNYKDIIFP